MKKRIILKKILLILAMTFLLAGITPARDVCATSTVDKEAAKAELREIVIDMYENGDASKRDISHLKLTFSEYNSVVTDVLENECWLAYQCYYNGIQQSDQYEEDGVKYMKTFWIYNVSPDFKAHYASVKNHIKYVQEQIAQNPKMTDMDKLVWIHDYIDRITTYKLDESNGFVHTAVGPFYYGYSVCDGYAKAMNLLLHEVGIEADKVSNEGHAWSLVKIDGEYYHVDATWDDTRTYKTGAYRTHYFMIRNDQEYRNDPYSPHTGFEQYNWETKEWKNTFSTSTKYTDWYVHSIIGDMYYYDGYWYYVEGDNIVKNTINGTADSSITVLSGSGITLTGITDGVLTYKENSVEKTVSLVPEKDDDSGNGGNENKDDDESGNGGNENKEDDESGSGGNENKDDDESGSGGNENKDDDDSGNGGNENKEDDDSGSGGNVNKDDDESGNGGNENKDDDESGNGGNENKEDDDSGNGGNVNKQDDNSGSGGNDSTQNEGPKTFKDKKSKAYYKILKQGKKTGTVAYQKPYSTAKGKITIPATVKKNGITYKVTGISANAFKNNKKITHIVIGKNVQTIDSKAFYNCKKLKTITINTTKLTSAKVNKNAFKGIKKTVKIKVIKSKYSKYRKLFILKGLKSKGQVVKK